MVDKAITKHEMARHCKRSTRGRDETERLIMELINKMNVLSDAHGSHLFESQRMMETFTEEKSHISCIQDPQDVILYTKVGNQVKGGVDLPIYRCARGSTSLESFHLHLNRFIPG